MDIIYIVYALLAVVGLALNITVFVLRLRRTSITQLHGISQEHRASLLIQDIILASVSFITLLSTLVGAVDSLPLCHLAGYSTVYALLVMTWSPLTTAIILNERERDSLRTKTRQELSAQIILFISSAILVISAGLVAINYSPITEFDKTRRLACVPLLFPDQTGAEYTKLQLALVWLGLMSVWGCMCAWLYFLMRNRRSVRYVTECHRSTKSHGAQVLFALTLWSISVTQFSIFYWVQDQRLLLAAIFFSILYLIGCPIFSLIGYWLGNTERQLSSSISRDMPARLIDINPLTINPDKNVMKFHGRWNGKFNERVHGVIKVYTPNERSRWLKEAQAMLLLRKTEHPNIAKYLWVSRGKSVQFPKENLSQEYISLLTDTDNRMACMQYYELGSLRELLLHKPSLITESTLKYVSLDIASALVHLRQLHIVHNKLSSKTVFIKSTPKNKMLTAAIGNFEESEHITLDYYRSEREKITPIDNQATGQIDNKFSSDIRSYALLLLELVSAWNKHNGQPVKVTENQKSSVSDIYTSPYYHKRPLPSEPTSPGTITGVHGKTHNRNRSLSKKPMFSEIREAPQSNLHHQRSLNGEHVAIEIDEMVDDLDMRGGACTSGTLSPDYTRSATAGGHIALGRQYSSSACSVDSGYTRSLGSSAAAYQLYNFPSHSNPSGHTAAASSSAQCNHPKHKQKLPELPKLQASQLELVDANNNPTSSKTHVIAVHEGTNTDMIVAPVMRVTSPVVCGNTSRLTPEALQNIRDYMKVKQTLPADILSEYEEYNIPDDSAFSDDEKIYETIPPHTKNEKSDSSQNISLSTLAELVTQDVNVFLRSRSNSGSSSHKSVTSRHRRQLSDTSSQASDVSHVTFSSTVERPLNVRMDKELYLDKIISDKHKLRPDTSNKFIYRSGVTKAQLYYSKELAVMYDIVTPQLLYLTEKTTKELLQAYRVKLKYRTLAELLVVSERCWLEDPVFSADLIQTQLRRAFTAPPEMKTASQLY